MSGTGGGFGPPVFSKSTGEREHPSSVAPEAVGVTEGRADGRHFDVSSRQFAEFKDRSVHAGAFPGVEQPQIELVIRERAAVADDDPFATGSCQGDVGAASVRQEAQFGDGVGADEGDHDRFLFSTLKAIDRVDLDGGIGDEFAE